MASENGTANGRGKFMNLLDQYVPVRNLLTWGVIGTTALIGGLKMEALMVQQFDSMTNQMAIQSAQLTAQEIQLRQIQDTMIVGKANRDQQMKQMEVEFAGLTTTVSDNHDDIQKQIGTINLKIGNIVQDMAVLKCQLRKC